MFDPYRYLTQELRAEVWIDNGAVRWRFARDMDSAVQRKRAAWCVRYYSGMIRIQIENGGVSVQKLIALGKIRLVGGRYVRL